MSDKYKHIFGDKAMQGFTMVLQHFISLFDQFATNYSKDQNARDALIDLMIELLQSEKTTKG